MTANEWVDLHAHPFMPSIAFALASATKNGDSVARLAFADWCEEHYTFHPKLDAMLTELRS